MDGFFPQNTAPALQVLLDAGGIMVGKANMVQLFFFFLWLGLGFNTSCLSPVSVLWLSLERAA